LILGNGNVYPQKGKFYALDRNLDPKQRDSLRGHVSKYGNNLRPAIRKSALRRRYEERRDGRSAGSGQRTSGNYQVAVVDQNKVSIRQSKW
jgi:hypothetical protein